MKRLSTGLLSALCLAPFTGLSQVSITDYNGTDGAALVNSILGPGYTVVGAPTYVGGAGQAGFFKAGSASGITLKSGILLTSGLARNAIGPNDNTSAAYSWATSGDSDLDKLVMGPDPNTTYPTYDANSLTFTFHANSAGTLHFNYVFASEEYNEWVNQYNDVFGFFLDGRNVALLPGTTTPVDIDSVNLQVNPQLYVNNATAGDPSPRSTPLLDIQYDGFTTPLTVDAYIAAGDHTIKLAVADTRDSVLDSGVFIQGRSFSSGLTSPDADESVPDGGCTLGLMAVGIAGLLSLGRVARMQS